ncbi:glycosyltransferase [Microbacterium koreense]|uniref:Glycosyltransferase n=1 Tax=Microbacterium koreense TaxID=323761 RepID=A0ABW2ZPR7_9MICO
MRLLFTTLGSRGDVEPFLNLARTARVAGHDVRVARPDDADTDAAGLDSVSLGIDLAELSVQVSDGSALRVFRERIRPAMARALATTVDVALDWEPDVIVAHPKVLTVPAVAEKLDIPYVQVELTPTLTPTREFPAAGIAVRSLGAVGNRLTYRVVHSAGAMFASDVRSARERLGLATRGRERAPSRTLAAISPALLSPPVDWPDTTVVTGDWKGTDVAATLDDDLATFVAAQAPLAYVGFGSMTGGDAVARADAIIAGARRAGLRVMIATGWGGLTPSPAMLGDDVLVRRGVPHSAVLPRAVVAMHHGGAGTTHAVTRAGVPSVVVPFLADQPFWAAHLHRRRLAGKPLHRHRLTADNVERELRAAQAYTARVENVARAMASENGTATALATLTGLA